MIIGLDFDNTIVSYDNVFHHTACKKGYIDTGVPVSKTAVRDEMRKKGLEEDWILLQGYVYGKSMAMATLFSGCLEFFAWSSVNDHKCKIISHKTRYPYRGPKYDLHEAAITFIKDSLIEMTNGFISFDDVSFHNTKEEKLEKISIQKCDVFLDDLPEILEHSNFPKTVTPVLFDPKNAHTEQVSLEKVTSWAEFRTLIDKKGKPWVM